MRQQISGMGDAHAAAAQNSRTSIAVVLCSMLGIVISCASFAQTAAQPQTPSLKSFKTFAPPLDKWPTAPSSDPRDFEGVYNVNPIDQHLTPIEGGVTTADAQVIPPFTPEAAALFWKRVQAQNDGEPLPDASILCEPSWKTRLSSMIRFMQVKDVLVLFFSEHHIVRLIHINGAHPRDLQPSYMGDSVGHWEGNTLVIDTIGFNDRGWWDFAGTPQSRSLHLTERMTKQADGSIEDLMTFEDPKLYTHPFKSRDIYRWSPATSAMDEEICEENWSELKFINKGAAAPAQGAK